MALPNEPITRQEMYLSNIAGQNTALPDAPITREEMYLDYIAKNGGTGEGDMKKTVYDSDNSVASAGGIKMFVNQKIGTLPQRVGTVEGKVTTLEGQMLEVENNLGNLGTASTKNSTSVVTDSSDLVESGAVKDIVGWGNKNLFDPNSNKNEWVTNNNQISTSRAEVKSVRVNCSEGDTLTLSNDNIASSTNILLIAYLDSQDNVLSRTVKGSADKFVTVTAPSDTACAICSFYTWAEVSKAQLEKGSTATAYEPYHASVEESLAEKCDNTVIAPTENGTTASQAYAVGSHAIRNGKFITWKNAKAQGETINDASDYTSGDVATQFGLYIPIANNAGFHNSIFRGKNLGSTVTTAQRNAIQAGTFEDMYIGDYWEINSVKYRIAHFDYWMNCGDTQCTTHHVVIVPDSALNFKNMNDKVDNQDTTAGAYINSKMYTTNLTDAKNIVKAAFGENNILTKREYFANAASNGFESGGSWYDSQIDLMNEIMVYGSNILHNCINGTSWPMNYTIDKVQLALFRLDQSYTIALNPQGTDRASWWLRDVCAATYFAAVGGYGNANSGGASNSVGVRPAFGIK